MNADTTLTAAPGDIRLTEAMIGKIDAEAKVAGATALRYHAISGGIILTALGLTAAACLFAYGQRNPSPEAWQDALAKMPPVKVEVALDPEAKVALASSEVTMKPGEVILKDGATVALADGATVDLDASGFKLPDTSGAAEKNADGDAIKREVVVFNFVSAGSPDESVATGWRYANGAAKKPSSEFCYLSVGTDDGAQRTDLAIDRKALPSTAKLPDSAALLAKCIWWSGSAS